MKRVVILREPCISGTGPIQLALPKDAKILNLVRAEDYLRIYFICNVHDFEDTVDPHDPDHIVRRFLFAELNRPLPTAFVPLLGVDDFYVFGELK